MKREKSNNLELLAPVGNTESFYAAINSGADAIYLGLQNFNARGNIENFDLDKLKEIVQYAHLFDVKVYLTFNILIKNDEMKAALNLVRLALNVGVDAFIIQDLGLACNIKKYFPKAVLHASTQMGIHNLEGAKFAEKFGFTRIVLSRETPLSEIKRIHEGTKLEIEYFIQGALCVAFSGNCYLCSLLTGNSGNRGKCQQFCRLPYEIEGQLGRKEGYLLSTKDFCMLPSLKDLADAGVMSFKIEGRARRPAYVAQCVQTYRKAIDNNFAFTEKDITDLKKVFNRGDYAQGYFKDEKIIYPEIQGHKGIKIGKVTKFETGKRFNVVSISSNYNIHAGDGLKFIKNGREVGSIGVGDVKLKGREQQITTTSKIEKGCDVYLTLDAENEKKLLSVERKLKIDAKFIAREGEKARLTFECKGKKVSVLSESAMERAKSQPLCYNTIYEQISKLKDTPFELENLSAEIDEIFARKSEINYMRRVCAEKLIKELLKKYIHEENNEKIEIKFEKKSKKCTENLIKIENINKFNEIKDKTNKIIYSPNKFDLNEIIKFAAYCEKSNKEGFLDLPIFANEKDILFIKNILKNTNTLGIVANNYYAFDLMDANKIIIGMGLNIFNNFSIDFYEKMGVKGIILSKELKPFDLDNFSSNVNLYMFAKGRDEYMTLKHCPFKEFFGSRCENCKFCEGLEYKMQNGKRLILERKKLSSCQFVLKSKDQREIDFDGIGKYLEY